MWRRDSGSTYDSLPSGGNIVDPTTEEEEEMLWEERHHVVKPGCVEGDEDPTQQESDASSDDGDSSVSFSSSPNNDDPFSAIVRQKAGGLALVAVLLLSSCLAANAVILAWQFHQKQLAIHHEQDAEGVDTRATTDIPSYTGVCSSSASNSTARPLWRSLLEIEMTFLTNLIHAALLAATALVVAYRGDVIWLLFVRNCAFYWTPVALLYFASDVDKNSSGGGLRLLSTATFAALSLVVLLTYGTTCRAIRRKVTEETTHLRLASHTLHYTSVFLQITTLTYFTITGSQWFRLLADCRHERHLVHTPMPAQVFPGGDFAPFVMAYSETAHSAFLLALFQQAAMYPTHTACVAGAAMTAAWRLAVATASLLHIAATWQHGSQRDMYSAAFTVTEVVSMIPVLLAASWLLLTAGQTKLPQLVPTSSMHGCEPEENPRSKVQKRMEKKMDCVAFAENHDDEGDFYHVELGQYVPQAMDELMKADAVSRFQCVTLSQIASSEQFSNRQRWGAWTLSLGSIGLLVEMTIESAIHLSQTFIGTNAEHNIFQWGMHACVMYAFCTSMCAVSSYVYQRARPLLAVACPAGSIIAIWQLSVLIAGEGAVTEDPWSMAVAVFFVWRAICGVVQTVGVLVLNHTAPSDCRPTLIRAAPTLEDEAIMESTRVMATRAFYMIFMPVFVTYVLFSTSSGNCSAPMISPMLPQAKEGSCMAADMDLMLKQNKPGLSLFFHFGLVTVMFAHDGLCKSLPTYKPSLLIACLWVGQTSLLILVALLWDMLQTQFWSSLSTEDVIRRVLLAMWSLTAGYLAFCLRRLWNLRQQQL